MRKLLFLLPLLLTLPASAQTLTKAQTAEFREQVFQHWKNAEAAGKADDWEMACASLQKQNAILATVMTDLQTHFPETIDEGSSSHNEDAEAGLLLRRWNVDALIRGRARRRSCWALIDPTQQARHHAVEAITLIPLLLNLLVAGQINVFR